MRAGVALSFYKCEMGNTMHTTEIFKERSYVAGIMLVLLFAFGTPAHAGVTVIPASLNFGTQAVGTTSAPMTVTLTNTGWHSITIKSASFSAAQFSYSGPSLPITLYRGQSLIAYVIFTPTAAQSYSGTLVFRRGNGWTISVALSGTGVQTQALTQPPTITTQPVSKTVTAGQTASFSVAASGTTPMTFQWNKNGAAISGATSSTYTTPATTTSDNAAQFTVVVTNSAGSATSAAAILTVNAAAVAPAITTQPVSKTVTAGQTASFSVAASGTTPMTYQWKKNGTAISGATSSTYTTPATTTSDNAAQFTVVVTNSAGSATSAAATLTVNAATYVLNASSTALSFGSETLSTTTSQNVTLTNAGNSNVMISNVSVSGAGFSASGVSTGLIVAPGKAATLTATFTPSATGSVTGSVTVSSNASPDTIALSGTGVAAVSHSVFLSWTASTSAVTGYYTYSSSVSGGPYTKLNSTLDTTTTYTDNTVQSGKTYYYVVTAVDSSNVESPASNQISATIP